MLALKLFLNSPRARKALRTKPGQEGFSLIELVVVIAILGILIAIALPNFLGVQKDAQVNQAKNALATIVKECGVKSARFDSSTFGQPGVTSGDNTLIASANGKLTGYTITTGADLTSGAGAVTEIKLGDAAAGGADSGKSCYEAEAFSDGDKLAHFKISFDPATAITAKTCYVPSATAYVPGCTLASGTTAGPAAGTW